MFIVENVDNAQPKEKEEKHFKTHFLEITTVRQFIHRNLFCILGICSFFEKVTVLHICSCNLLLDIAIYFMPVNLFFQKHCF